MQVSDLMKLPYPDDFFDGAIDVVAVCYCGFEEAQRAYHALARVAKPGARISAAVWSESPDLTPPRPPAYAEDGTDLLSAYIARRHASFPEG